MLSSAAKKIKTDVAMVGKRAMASFEGFSLKTLDGEEVKMSKYIGNPTLILNCATL